MVDRYAENLKFGPRYCSNGYIGGVYLAFQKAYGVATTPPPSGSVPGTAAAPVATASTVWDRHIERKGDGTIVDTIERHFADMNGLSGVVQARHQYSEGQPSRFAVALFDGAGTRMVEVTESCRRDGDPAPYLLGHKSESIVLAFLSGALHAALGDDAPSVRVDLENDAGPVGMLAVVIDSAHVEVLPQAAPQAGK